MEHTFAAALAVILVTGTIVAGFFALENHFSEEDPLPAENEISLPEEEPEKTVLGIFDEKLALFVGESPYPNVIYDFFVRNLPPEDRERLSEGITVSSENELESLLEDFMS